MAAAPVVTGIRKAGRHRVAIDLDGAPWRVLSAEAVVAARIETGVALDRERARRLRTELRRVEARDAALSALSRRDHTVTTLSARLAARGVAPAVREATLETVTSSGLVDDARFAHARAALLVERGAGDALIRDDLARTGVSPELVTRAIAALEPEAERAERIVAAKGRSAKTLRHLTAKGFGGDVLEALVADVYETELG